MLRYLSKEGEKLRGAPQPDVCFNYLGQFDHVLSGSSLFRPARESVGPLYNPQASRPYPLYISGDILRERLRIRFHYSQNRHRRSTIVGLAQGFLEELRTILRSVISLNPTSDLPTHFMLAQLNRNEIEKALAQVEFEGV
jgi:non-ribosomal peptide synthase protein (TIGR01720 family)